jgi:outer membrane lipoprotein-sorting protein
MKLKYFLFVSLIITEVHSFSQENHFIQDPAAGQILERVAQKTKSLSTLQTDFELLIQDRKEGSNNTSTGKLLLKQKKYQLVSEGSTVYFDGKTMWTYVPGNNEVTVTEPESTKGNFLSNPTTFFDTYKIDYKYRYVRETQVNGVICHSIDLYPKNLNQPYSRIKIYISKNDDLPVSISSIGKDGVDYTVNLRNMVLNREIPDREFIFEPSKHKKTEIVDMRGL